MRALILFLAFVLTPIMSHGTERHIAPGGSDSGPCLPATPCATFNYARTQVASGDTLYFRAGSYGNIIINGQNPIANGTSNTNRTIIAGYPGETVDVSGIDFAYGACFGPSYSNPVCGLSQYITLRNFRLLSNGISVAGCKYANHEPTVYSCGAHFIRIEDIERTNPNQPGACIGSGYGASDLEFVNIHVHHCGINLPYDGVHPPAHGFYTCSPNTVYDNIHSHDNAGYGFQHYESYWNTSTGDTAFGCGDGVIIRNSYVHDNGKILPYGGIIMADGHNMQVYNNVIVNNTGDGLGWIYSLDTGHLDNVQTYNNTIVGNTGWGLVLGNPPTSATQLHNPIIRNNIIYGNAGGGQNIKEVNVSSPTYSNNLCNSLTTGCAYTGPPAFDNPSAGTADGFKILGSSDARNHGATLTAFTTDKALVHRPQGSGWDIGAYEYPEGGGTPISGNPIYLSAGGYGDTPTDSGDCSVPETITTPRATLAAALLCMQIPGKVLYIRGGTYAGKIDTSGGAVVGGSAALPTRIEGYGSEVVTLQLNEDGVPAVYLQGITYFTLNKVTVNAMARPFSNGLACVGASQIKILNSAFHNTYFEAGYFADCDQVEVTQSTFHDSATKAVIGLAGTITNVTFDQVEVYNGPLEGIKANVGSGSNSSLSILRTQIHHTGTGAGGAALDLGPGTGALLVNTILDHNSAGLRLRAGANGTKVYHNAVAANTGVGLQCDAPARTGANIVTLSNNLSFGNGTDGVVNTCNALETSPPTMTTDPLWVDVAGRNFLLQTTPVASPALDQLSTVPPEAAIALDGTPRPVNFLSDIGPYEQGAPPVVTPPTTVVPLVTRFLGMWY